MNIREILARIQANKAAGKPANSGLSKDEVALVQQELVNTGQLKASDVDSLWGPKTEAALALHDKGNPVMQNGYNFQPTYDIQHNGQVPYNAAPYQGQSDGYKPNYDYEKEINDFMSKGVSNPGYAAQIKQYNDINTANKAANVGVLGYDIAQSIGQIGRSNRAVNNLTKPNQISPSDKNNLLQRELYLAKMRASQGMSGQQKDFSNAQGLDNFLKSKAVAETSSAGQASGYGSARQKAILDRYKYGIQNNILNDQIRQQNQGTYNNMIASDMNENNNIRGQKMVNYNDSLNQFNQRQAAAQHLGQTGRINMRKSIGDARELAPTFVPGYGSMPNPYASKPVSSPTANVSPNLYNDPEINNIVNTAVQNTNNRYNAWQLPLGPANPYQ